MIKISSIHKLHYQEIFFLVIKNIFKMSNELGILMPLYHQFDLFLFSFVSFFFALFFPRFHHTISPIFHILNQLYESLAPHCQISHEFILPLLAFPHCIKQLCPKFPIKFHELKISLTTLYIITIGFYLGILLIPLFWSSFNVWNLCRFPSSRNQKGILWDFLML